MAIRASQLIDVAVERGLIDEETMNTLRTKARRERIDIVDALASHGRFPVATLYRALAESRGLNFVDLASVTPSPELLRRLPRGLVQRRQVLPLVEDQEGVIVVTADPDDRPTIDAIQRIIGKPLTVAVSDPTSLDAAIQRGFADHSRTPFGEATSPEVTTTDPVTLLDSILKEAFLRRASDIHLDPQEQGMRVRFRVDGRLQVFLSELGPAEGSGLLSRVKVLGGLDIAEQRSPQDGGFSYQAPHTTGTPIDIRLATAPTRWGERATMRLLGLETPDLTLEAIGMRPSDLSKFRKAIQRPHGIILLTGPTGSGKTTTLYAALRELNGLEMNILTVEDPIEYVVPNISQTQVGEKISFASALRSFLRHDPDVLLVGEIRDFETADVAMKSSMTGHLVFSTLHTHSAPAAITRLLNIGCERHLIASTLVAVIAQRLIRRLCPKCVSQRPATPEEATMLGRDSQQLTLAKPQGCAHCLGTGYRGRMGIFEAFWINSAIAKLIAAGVTEDEITAAALQDMTTLWQDGAAKVLEGATTLDEVLAITMHEG